MFIFKNAWISITRNKGRNILIGIIILVVACASTITLAISNTAADLINSYQSAYDKELTIAFNREKMTKDVDFSNREKLDDAKEKFENISAYTISDVEKFAESDYIESYYYTYNVSLDGENIEKAESSSSEGSSSGDSGSSADGSGRSGFSGFPGGGSSGGSFGPSGSSEYDFTLNGYSSVEAMSEFIEGTYTMVEIDENAWEKAFSGNYVFINEELASYNELKIGSKIKLKDGDGKTYQFEVVGIYKENESGASGPADLFSNSANTIITNASALTAITKANSNVKGSVDPTFIIRDYGDAEAIQAEFYEKGLDENYVVETNEETATAGVKSIKNVQSFATAFLVITLVIGGVVLFVINMINIRERKYEIGVLRTIGISKAKLTAQFVSELMMVGIIALLVGAGIGAVAAKDVSNSLLASEISSSQEATEKVKGNFGPGGFPGGSGSSRDGSGGSSSDDSGSSSDSGGSGSSDGGGSSSDFGPSGFSGFGNFGKPNVQAYESIDAVVDVKVVMELLGIGVGLILISSLAAMISIQRFSPLTILKERS